MSRKHLQEIARRKTVTLQTEDATTGQSPLQVPGLPQLTGGEVFASSRQRTLTNTDWKDVQPRFGFASLWSATSHTLWARRIAIAHRDGSTTTSPTLRPSNCRRCMRSSDLRQPATDVDDPLFGQIRYSPSAPRQGQFGAKVTFQVTFARSRSVS